MRETYGRIDSLCNAEKTLHLAEFLRGKSSQGASTDVKVTNKLIHYANILDKTTGSLYSMFSSFSSIACRKVCACN